MSTIPWFKIDDGFWSHPKVLELSDGAVALWVRAGAYCAGHLTDGLVRRSTLRMLGADRDAAVELVLAGLWDEAGEGWTFHDWAEYQPTREQVVAERAGNARRQELSRNPELREAIRRRDGDNCRYCGVTVNWSDRKSSIGGTYDHVDPDGANVISNLVVACRGCNSRKGKRTPDAARMPLLEPGTKLRSDLVTDQAPSRPVPSRPLDSSKTYESQSSSNRARETTDSGFTSEMSKRMASQAGVKDPDMLAGLIRTALGITVEWDHLAAIVNHLTRKSRTPVKDGQAYAIRCLNDTPEEVRQFIFESGFAS